MRIAARKEEEATLKAAEGEAARKRRKLQPTPKWKPGSMAALISASSEEEGTGDVFEDVQTAAEAEAAAEAERYRVINDYLDEQ